MGSYILFQFTTLKKKVGPYIILALSILVIGLLAVLSARGMNNEGMSSVKEISTFTKFFPFLFGVLFASFVIAHVFKEGESDGSELIVVAKPLSRKQIVFGKFLLVLAYVIAYQLIMFIAYIAFTHADTKSTEMEKMKWALSLFIGGLIVQIIASAIIIMLASVLGKVGTIVVSILIAAILPILSFTLVPLGKGWGAGSIGDSNGIQNRYIVNVDSKDQLAVNPDDIYRVVPGQESEDKLKSSYDDKRWYDAASYFDIWYHWGRFYSMFMPTATNETSLVKWQTENVDTSKWATITSQGEKYFIFPEISRADAYKYDKFVQEKVKQYEAKIAQDGANYASKTFAQRVDLVDPVKSDMTNIENISRGLALVLAENNLKIDHAAITKTEEAYGFFNSSKTIKALQPHDYLPTYAVVIIWSVIGIGMCAGALAIYSKRDFK